MNFYLGGQVNNTNYGANTKTCDKIQRGTICTKVKSTYTPDNLPKYTTSISESTRQSFFGNDGAIYIKVYDLQDPNNNEFVSLIDGNLYRLAENEYFYTYPNAVLVV